MNPLARIIDANFNRAREALRVMEDAARFALDHPGLAQRLKELRHDLHAGVEALAPIGIDRGHRLANRDTPGDVGASLRTPAEGVRMDLAAVAAAAGGRLTEALRAIEEAAKACGGDGFTFEQLRYRAYEAERQLGLAFPAGAAQWRLCILITESLCTRQTWEEVARAAIRGGADCLQLREKELEGGELLERARRLVAIAREEASRRVAVIVNDRPDIAVLARADGVHLGQTDLPVQEARKIVGFGIVIGISTTDLDQAQAAIREGADYCGVGPMFPSTTKERSRISGPAYLREYLADPVLAAVPHLAIGGITPENAAELWAGGCRGIAVSAAVCGAADPAGVCRRLLAGP